MTVLHSASATAVLLDASSLRRQVGLHAQAINALSVTTPSSSLRERMGHNRSEIFAGLLVGAGSAWLVWYVLAGWCSQLLSMLA